MGHRITCANEKCKYYGFSNKCLLKNVAIDSECKCASYVLSDYYKPNVRMIDTSPMDEHTNMC